MLSRSFTITMTKSTGVGRGNYTRKPGLKRKRLTLAEKKTKAFAMSLKKPRATISQAGVGGAKAQMSAGLQLPQEVKSVDTAISVAPATGDWSYASSAALANIRQGVLDNQRIGRKIRLVGILVRATVNTEGVAQGEGGQPYTVDLIQDTQCNGNVPGLTTVYQAAGRNNLPNSNFQQRFRWLARREVQGQQTSASTVNITYKCNILVSFDADNGLVSDIEKNNILLSWCSVDPTPNMTGIIRFMYVDA